MDEIKLWDLFQSRDQVFREKQEKVLGVQKRTTMIGGWNSFWEMLLEWRRHYPVVCAGRLAHLRRLP